MRAPKPSAAKLGHLGIAAESLLKVVLDDMKRDAKEKGKKYTLTDQMKIIDRVAKFEAIRAKISDDEGGFFDQPTDEGAENERDD